MSSMKYYTGVGVIEAKPMTRFKYLEYHTGRHLSANVGTDQEGYLVEYPDGYLAWLPKEAFDQSHLKLDNPAKVNEKPDIDHQPYIVEERKK